MLAQMLADRRLAGDECSKILIADRRRQRRHHEPGGAGGESRRPQPHARIAFVTSEKRHKPPTPIQIPTLIVNVSAAGLRPNVAEAAANAGSTLTWC